MSRRPTGNHLSRSPAGDLGRVYVHTKCGGATHASGAGFKNLCDPFHFILGVVCCGCSRIARVRDVYWEDTGEPVAQYRKRLRRQTPTPLKVWRYGLGYALGGVIGAAVVIAYAPAWRIQPRHVNTYIVLGAVVCAYVVNRVGTFVLKKTCGVEYYRIP